MLIRPIRPILIRILKQILFNNMKIKYLISFVIIGLALIGSVDFINKVLAQETVNSADIKYPVVELGNCESQSACRSYCDESENTDVCLDFAEKNNLMSEKDVSLAKKFVGSGSKGPGGCSGKRSCNTYCDDITHIDECVAFAEKNGLMSVEELGEAKKVQSAIAKGVKPPACGNKKECDVYCEDSSHMEECINFGVAAGFIQGKELEDSQKMLAAFKRGIRPLPCHGRKACDEYCGSPDNMEVCMNFAAEAGFMNEKEKDNSQKMLAAFKKGVKPPNCRGKEGCDDYCGEEEHMEECANFAEAAGFMTSEEAKMARKTGGKGPGDCKSKDECDAFCGNPDNQETCFNFAKDNGMMSEKDLKRIEERKQEMGPPKPGTINPGGQMMPQQAGPGGCKGPEECKEYCDTNPDACKDKVKGSNGQEDRRGPNRIEEQRPQVRPCEGDNCKNGLPRELQPERELRENKELRPSNEISPSSLIDFKSLFGSLTNLILSAFER